MVTSAGAVQTLGQMIDDDLQGTLGRAELGDERHPLPYLVEFLAAGRPALQWGRDLAQAARQSVSMMDGYLAVPPFPFAEAVPKK